MDELSITLAPDLFPGDRPFQTAIKPYCEDLLARLGDHMPGKLKHLNRVGGLMGRVCVIMGMNEQDAFIHAQAARMHDIGYLSRPRSEWRTDEKPDDAEKLRRRILHTVEGEKILGESPVAEHNFIILAREMALYHHEKLDGTGPHGEDRLSRTIQILGAVDAYDGDQVTANKPGVPVRTPQEALERLYTEKKYAGGYREDILQAIAQAENLS